MALVTISEAAKLTGKSRTTIHRHISTGKLSKVQDGAGNFKLDISELIRVYGSFKNVLIGQTEHSSTELDITLSEHNKNNNELLLRTENEQLKKQIDLLKDHVSTLKQALVLLEYKKEEKEQSTPIQEEPNQPPEVKQVTQSTPEPETPPRKKFLGIF